jgi:LuxR family transcriptional regulator, maltose regulon positive regulatory protein
MPVPILSTKLFFPLLRLKLVDRPRLFKRLDQGEDCGFVLVCAPAGYGKSTLIGAWLRRTKAAAVWLSLDEADNDPVRFLTYLATALGKIVPSAGEVLVNSLHASPLPAVDILLTPLLNHLNLADRLFWLVMDDYHVIQNQIIHQVVGFLVEHRPTPLHLAIATRADPPLPLARLRARSQMVEMRMDDLRFSIQETEEFLCQVFGLNLDKDDMALLAANTEGWAVGLQMAGLSLQGRKDASAFIRSFSGENRYILDFLFEEVFQKQPEDIQLFLLQTAILGQLCGPLCDQVTQRTNSQEIIETLEKKNLFLIALDEQRHWHRYHYLFRDLLNTRLQLTFPDLVFPLHQRASAWFASNHDSEHAIAHALAARDFERAACLIEQNLQYLDLQNQQALLTSWVTHLPAEILINHPWLCVWRAWGDYWSGRRGDEEVWLQKAERSAELYFAAGTTEKRRIHGHIAAVRAHAALVIENIPYAQEMAHKALSLLPEDDTMRCETAIALGGAYWALGNAKQSEQAFAMAKAAHLENSHPTMLVGPLCYSGMQQVKQGRLRDALSTFREGLRLSTLPDGQETPIAGFPNVMLGDVFRERNDLETAQAHISRGLSQCIRLGQPDIISYAYACLARYQYATGDAVGAQDTFRKAAQLSRQKKVDPFVVCWLDEVRLKIYLAQGDLEAAELWAQNSGLTLDGSLNYLHDLPEQNLVRMLVAQGFMGAGQTTYQQACSLLVRLLEAARQAGWVHEEIKFLNLQTINHHAHGLTTAAMQNLAQALILAEPGGYVRIFLDEGKVLRDLLVLLANSLHGNSFVVDRLHGPQPSTLNQSGMLLLDDPLIEKEQIARLDAYISRLLTTFETSIPCFTKEPTTAMVTRKDAVHPASPGEDLIEQLTEREMDVLQLLAQGNSDKQIAEALVIARETVHKHLKNIYGKLDVHNRTAAVARARAYGLI